MTTCARRTWAAKGCLVLLSCKCFDAVRALFGKPDIQRYGLDQKVGPVFTWLVSYVAHLPALTVRKNSQAAFVGCSSFVYEERTSMCSFEDKVVAFGCAPRLFTVSLALRSGYHVRRQREDVAHAVRVLCREF